MKRTEGPWRAPTASYARLLWGAGERTWYARFILYAIGTIIGQILGYHLQGRLTMLTVITSVIAAAILLVLSVLLVAAYFHLRLRMPD